MKPSYKVIIGFECVDVKGQKHVIPQGVYLTYDNIDNGNEDIIHINFLDGISDSIDIKNNFNIDQYLMRIELDSSEVESDVKKESPIKGCEDNNYCSFTIANYALTDVIEALTAAKAKDIIVTKVDGDLVVKYKPYWRG